MITLVNYLLLYSASSLTTSPISNYVNKKSVTESTSGLQMAPNASWRNFFGPDTFNHSSFTSDPVQLSETFEKVSLQTGTGTGLQNGVNMLINTSWRNFCGYWTLDKFPLWSIQFILHKDTS